MEKPLRNMLWFELCTYRERRYPAIAIPLLKRLRCIKADVRYQYANRSAAPGRSNHVIYS